MPDPENDSTTKTEEAPGVGGEKTRLTDRKVELAYKIADKIADVDQAHDLPIPHSVPNQGSVKAVLDGARESAMAYKVKQDIIDVWADASHGAQQQNPDPALKAQNDNLESVDRLNKGQELYQKEKNALAEQTKSEEFQKKSFADKAKEVDAQFAKSNQQQAEYKSQQDIKYKDLAGEHALVQKELTSLNEQARQEHQNWRQDVAGGICKDEATAQINHKIEDRVGQYQSRLNEMGSKFTDVQAMTEKYKVQLEDKKPEQVQQRSTELQQQNFKSVEVPSIAPPTAPAGPGGGGPGGGGPGGGGPGGGGPGGR